MNDHQDFRSNLADLLPQLRRFALALTRSKHDADDLVQSAVERALTRSEQWTPDTRLDSWVYKIMQNLWIDQRRQAARRETSAIDTAEHITGDDGREITENRLMAGRAKQAFDALPDDLRAAAVLVIANGLSYAEAAKTLDVPIGTIMSRVSRSRAAVIKALEGH
ncbi:MAG TPA: RNA polymerase sigma factor [Rhizomicrobium sp.]|jgi:RNA polymerase sigma-70 factor (ECF subfamily)|nr:RNA polymerase sigma factor [Rhizomicrobium sp.]